MFTVTLSYGDGGKLNVMNTFSFDNADGDAVKGGYNYKLLATYTCIYNIIINIIMMLSANS